MGPDEDDPVEADRKKHEELQAELTFAREHREDPKRVAPLEFYEDR